MFSRLTALSAAAAGALAVAICGAAAPAFAKPGNSNAPGNSGKAGNSGNSGNSGNAGGNGGQGVFDIGYTPTPCALSDIGPGASACLGWFPGNFNNGSDLGTAAQILNALLNTNVYTAQNAGGVDDFKGSGSTIDFSTPLFGDTVLAIHVGGANGAATGVGYQGTAYYRFDAGNLAGGLDVIDFNRQGLSNARLVYTSRYIPECIGSTCGGGGGILGVPEPGAWALMILGFGGTGAMLRRRRALHA